MKTFVRTLLVWFVLLAIPFQGFAAAAMTCAHGVASAPVNAADQDAQPPCHGAVQDDSPGDHGGEPQHQKCGNCAACSVGAAIAPGAGNPPAPACPCGRCPATAPAPVAVADPDLPDRPPRHALA